MAADQHSHFHVADELHTAGAATVHPGAEYVPRRTAFTEVDPVNRELFASSLFRGPPTARLATPDAANVRKRSAGSD